MAQIGTKKTKIVSKRPKMDKNSQKVGPINS